MIEKEMSKMGKTRDELISRAVLNGGSLTMSMIHRQLGWRRDAHDTRGSSKDNDDDAVDRHKSITVQQ